MVTGRKGSGKTMFLQKLVNTLSKSGIDVGGFIAEGSWRENQRSGFVLIPLKDKRQLELCTADYHKGYISFGHFWFNPSAIQLGKEVIRKDAEESEIIVVDEAGIFELQEKIWFDSLMYLLENTSKPVIISVREKIVSEVIEKFELQNVTLFTSEESVSKSVGQIIDDISIDKKQ